MKYIILLASLLLNCTTHPQLIKKLFSREEKIKWTKKYMSSVLENQPRTVFTHYSNGNMNTAEKEIFFSLVGDTNITGPVKKGYLIKLVQASQRSLIHELNKRENKLAETSRVTTNELTTVSKTEYCLQKGYVIVPFAATTISLLSNMSYLLKAGVIATSFLGTYAYTYKKMASVRTYNNLFKKLQRLNELGITLGMQTNE